MCIYPIQFNGNTVACRHCDECYEGEVNDWCARAMAERATSGSMLAITYTYAPLEDGTDPPAATAFQYSDFRAHMKLLRSAYYRKFNVRGQPRFMVCGERGSNGTQRIHWHGLLFSDENLLEIGKFTDFETGQKVENPQLEVNYIWSAWPHGNIRIQEPSKKGVYYALKYAFKDRYAGEKAIGTKRQTTAHNWAASKFRMSKSPPIGTRYLDNYLDNCESNSSVPPNTMIPIPDYDGYWYPKGKIREEFLTRCKEINDKYREKTGRDTAQWKTLLQSVSQNENIKDEETLLYGKVKENEEIEATAFTISESKASAQRHIIRKCGRILPCTDCAATWSPEVQQELYAFENELYDAWTFKNGHPFKPTPELVQKFREYWATRFIISRGCRNRENPETKTIFNAVKAITKFARSVGSISWQRDEGAAPTGGKAPHKGPNPRQKL